MFIMPKCIPTPLRKRLVDKYQAGEDYMVLARELGIKKDTAYRIVKGNRQGESRRGKARGQQVGKLNDVMKTFICQCVDNQPTITLKEICQKLSDDHDMRVSDSTVSRVLSGFLYTLKKVENVPEARNSIVNKQKRGNYAQWFRDHADETFIFYDESGFDLWQSRTRGRAKVGVPVRRTVNSQKTPHVTLLLAVSPTLGVVSSRVMSGGAKKPDVTAFITRMLTEANHRGLFNANVVIDNAPAHAGLEASLALDNTLPAHNLVRLPPYSCEFNPIECMFNVCKSTAKQALNNVHNVDRRPNETMLAHRYRVLSDIVAESIGSITTAKVGASFMHCITQVVPKALRHDNM